MPSGRRAVRLVYLDAMSAPEQIEAAVRAALEAMGVRYEEMPCDPNFADTAAFCERYGVPPERSANTILVASKKDPKRYGVGIVLATTRLDVNKKMTELLEVRRLSFATAEETVAATGMMVGGVTPFSLPAELPVFVDARVMRAPDVVLGGGSRSMKVRVAPEVLSRLPNVTVVEGLAFEKEPTV
jgi:prolyl-tRNA editing enzyme YbaK/EbsC (Cys-tRNA(Pro) deacylase)